MRNILVAFALTATISTHAQESQERSSRFGIEVPVGMVNTTIDLPQLMTGLIQKVESGAGYDIGIGVTYQNAGHFNFRGGFHSWRVPFKPTVNNPPDQTKDYVIENGLLTYYGAYIRGEFGNKYFFIGGGFDFSFGNQYKADRAYYKSGKLTKTETNQNQSILTNHFSNLFNMVVNTGFKIPIQDQYYIKPYVSAGFSFSSVYPTADVTNLGSGIYYTTPQKVDLQYIPILGYGVSLEYKFK